MHDVGQDGAKGMGPDGQVTSVGQVGAAGQEVLSLQANEVAGTTSIPKRTENKANRLKAFFKSTNS